MLFQSSLWALDQQGGAEALMHQGQQIERGLNYPPMYYVAVCAKSPQAIQSLPALSLYGDAEESVYKHYYKQIRYGTLLRERIAELEAQLASNSRSNE